MKNSKKGVVQRVKIIKRLRLRTIKKLPKKSFINFLRWETQ